MNPRLKSIMAKICDFDIAMTSDAEALKHLEESSSLKMMTFIATVEDAFEISFSDQDIIAMLDMESIEEILMNNLVAISEEV